MEIKEFQEMASEIIKKLDSHLGVNHDEKLTLLHLYEEVGELTREIINKDLKKEQSKEHLEEELSDCLLMLMHLANLYNINVLEAFNKKKNLLTKRFGVEI